MDHAIGIRLKKADAALSPLSSHFFGSPKVPFEWVLSELYETELLLCQLDLGALAEFDPSVELPRTGFLYVLLQMREGIPYHDVRILHTTDTPDYLAIAFNADAEGFEHLTEPWAVEFYRVAPDAPCSRLLGDYTVNPFKRDHPRLFLQLDLAELNALGVDFLPNRSDYLCIYLGDDDAPFENLDARFVSKK